MINVANLSFSYADRVLFNNVSFVVGKNQKIGLVGPNGAGKSTLLSLVSKTRESELGKVQVLGTVASVAQEIKNNPVLDSSETVRVYLDPEHEHHDFELRKMLDGLELSNIDFNSDPRKMSGGQKTRLALIKALMEAPDILLLDEPTNFLDVQGKQWVMNFLASYPNTVLLISHDLSLLDKSIDKIFFINIQTKKVEEYTGNYSQFLRLKEEKTTLVKKQIKSGKQHIQSLEKGLKKGNQSVRVRIQMQKRIERAKEKLPELPLEAAGLKNIKLPEHARSGEIPMSVNHIHKSYGEVKILNNINFYLERGERLTILGKNGAGKSTLIKILAGLLEPDSGQIVRDSSLKLGYYSQEHEAFDPEKSVIETVRDASHLTDGHIRSILGKFMFSENKIYQTIGTLSGGEKTRLAICMLVLQDFNMLILDEPTTYLDVVSQRVILEALKQYKGAMIIVSHTQDFIVELAPNRVLLLPENKMDYWNNHYLEKITET